MKQGAVGNKSKQYNGIGTEEKKGLTYEEIKIAESAWLSHGASYALSKDEAFRLYELYLLGYSFTQILSRFPEYSLDKVILTAALHLWGADRVKIAGTLKNRIQSKVVKSVVEQVDFLTDMLSDASEQSRKEIAAYKADPDNNPKPKLAINSLNDYKTVLDMVHKLVSNPGRTLDSQANSVFLQGLKNMDNLTGGLATQENTYIEIEESLEQASTTLASLAAANIRTQNIARSFTSGSQEAIAKIKEDINEQDLEDEFNDMEG
jgi:hypothetical protein